jgi:dienelactone hydrolase
MHKKLFTYQDNETVLEASAAYPKTADVPIIVVCHAWNGRDGFIEETIEKIASWGFVGFALDVYGKGIVGKSREENIQLKAPFLKDRMMLKKRLIKGLELAKTTGDSSKIIVMGFGFGGLCALDLARSDSSIQGAISIYGHFEEAAGLENKTIKAKVLLLHGAEDPVVPIQDLENFGKDLTHHKVDWQAHIFGNTVHAFMNPQANDPGSGIQYQPISASRTWRTVEAFLQDLLL